MSLRDHSVPGLTKLADQEQEQLDELTNAYRDRFGFPLIMCLRERPHLQAVLDHGAQRLHNAPAYECHAAALEVARIAEYRFGDLVATEARPKDEALRRNSVSSPSSPDAQTR